MVFQNSWFINFEVPNTPTNPSCLDKKITGRVTLQRFHSSMIYELYIGMVQIIASSECRSSFSCYTYFISILPSLVTYQVLPVV